MPVKNFCRSDPFYIKHNFSGTFGQGFETFAFWSSGPVRVLRLFSLTPLLLNLPCTLFWPISPGNIYIYFSESSGLALIRYCFFLNGWKVRWGKARFYKLLCCALPESFNPGVQPACRCSDLA